MIFFFTIGPIIISKCCSYILFNSDTVFCSFLSSFSLVLYPSSFSSLLSSPLPIPLPILSLPASSCSLPSFPPPHSLSKNKLYQKCLCWCRKIMLMVRLWQTMVNFGKILQCELEIELVVTAPQLKKAEIKDFIPGQDYK